MKKKSIALTILFIGVLTSCGKNKSQETIDKFISEQFSEIEKKDVKIDKKEMSDRDAFQEVKDYYYKESQSEQRKMNSNPNPETAPIYFAVIENLMKQESTMLDSLAKSKGKRLFTKAIITRVQEDTISHSILYIDDKGNIAVKRLLK